MKWTIEELDKLNELASNTPLDKLALILGRSEKSVYNKLFRGGIKRQRRTRDTKERWSEADLQWLKENYDLHPLYIIAEKLGYNRYDIANKAKKLGIKKSIYYNKLDKLLENNLEAFYWVGFLLADGNISADKKYISFCLSSKDACHLEKYCNFIESKTKIRTNKSSNGFAQSSQTTNIRHQIGSKLIIEQICKKFDIKPRKTYNPPDFNSYDFSKDQLLALIIGFIDGDGCIFNSNKKYGIRIKIHNSWIENLRFINYFICDYFNEPVTIKINNTKYPILSFYKKNILLGLKQFIKNHNLPALERKWSRLD